MKKIIVVLIIFAALVLGSVYFLNRSLVEKENLLAGKTPAAIGFSIGVVKEERWAKDRDFFVKRVQSLGGVVSVVSSDNNPEQQIYQIENLISQGVKVIVIVPSDSEKISPAIEKAKMAGVKIIAYDRLIKNSDLDLYISFDNEKVGRLQAESVLLVARQGKIAYLGGSTTDNNSVLLKNGAMTVLNEKIKNGDIELVIDEFIPDWKADEAYRVIKKYLDSGKTLDGVVVANDGMASGVIRALAEKGLAGKIPVSGQDAELSATQRIISGTQTSTVYKPIELLANKAADLAILIVDGKEIITTASIDNGKKIVPAYFLEPILVDRNNMVATVITDGFHSYEDVYKISTK